MLNISSKLIPYIFGLTILGLLELVFFYPKFLILFLILAIIETILVIGKILPKPPLPEKKGLFKRFIKQYWEILVYQKNYYYFISLPTLLISGIVLMLLPRSARVAQIIIIVLGISCFLLIKNLFLSSEQSVNDLKNSRQDIFDFLNFLTLFFVYADLLGLLILFNIPLWLLFAMAIICTAWSTINNFYIHHIVAQNKILYTILITLVTTELLLTIIFLPGNFYVTSLILIILYHAILKLALANWQQKLNKKLVIQYFSMDILLISALALTAKWT